MTGARKYRPAAYVIARILEESLDEIFATEYKWMKDCIEAKLFGIGLEVIR